MNMTRSFIGAPLKDIDHVLKELSGDLLIDLYPNRISISGAYKVFDGPLLDTTRWIRCARRDGH